MAKKKPICICDEKAEEPRQLTVDAVIDIIRFLTGLVHEVACRKVSLDEAITLHKLIGKEYFDPKGHPYYVDDSYALETLIELGKRGIGAVNRLKKREATKCARTTSSTRRKASKRKNV